MQFHVERVALHIFGKLSLKIQLRKHVEVDAGVVTLLNQLILDLSQSRQLAHDVDVACVAAAFPTGTARV